VNRTKYITNQDFDRLYGKMEKMCSEVSEMRVKMNTIEMRLQGVMEENKEGKAYKKWFLGLLTVQVIVFLLNIYFTRGV